MSSEAKARRGTARLPGALALLLLLVLAACTAAEAERLSRGLQGALGTGASGAAGLSREEIAQGLREALKVGTDRAVTDLARENAFFANPTIHIPLPPTLAQAQAALQPFGLAGLLDDLELRLNRGAEQAMPVARGIFWDAIAQLTFTDVMDIWQGADDAATRYFERTTSNPLTAAMREPVRRALSQAGAIQLYESLLAQTRGLPLLPNLRADLTDHVLDLGLDALFNQLAQEERAIREDPVARTTEILRRVFGAQA